MGDDGVGGSSTNGNASSELRRYAAFLGASGVVLGAAGAHGLQKRLAEKGRVDNWRTAVLYQLFHAATIVGISALCKSAEANNNDPEEATHMLRVGRLLTAGTLMFSGSIYGLCLDVGARKILGPTTPLGGLFMIAGWTLLGFKSK